MFGYDHPSGLKSKDGHECNNKTRASHDVEEPPNQFAMLKHVEEGFAAVTNMHERREGGQQSS